MGTCGSVKHRRLLVLHFVLKYKKKRHTNGLRTMAPVTSELTAYIHDHNPLRCNMCYNKGVRFHPFYPLILTPLMETGDSNSVNCQNPTCAWCLNYLQTIITNYLRGMGVYKVFRSVLHRHDMLTWVMDNWLLKHTSCFLFSCIHFSKNLCWRKWHP